MRIGLIARAEERGLGIQTWEFARHLKPAAVLAVDMGELARGFAPKFDRYDSPMICKFDGHQFVDEEMVHAFLDQVDVVYTAETFYDQRFPGWCKLHGVKLCVHINPEFFTYKKMQIENVQWWAPTDWRINELPAKTRVVPVPVALDRWPEPSLHEDEAVFLHVAGHAAAHDRNGTRTFLEALKSVSAPCAVRLVSQDAQIPNVAVSSRVSIEVVTNGVDNYWDLYQGSSVMVLPRKYGGLCLPANEACGAGLALIMTDVSPNHRWPIDGVLATRKQWIRTPAGKILMSAASFRGLSDAISRLAVDHERRWKMQDMSRRWAERMSWDNQKQAIIDALAS